MLSTSNKNLKFFAELEDGIFEGDLWDSDALNPGETFSHTFNEVGKFPYFCTVHGGGDMEGRIIVAAGGPDPTPTGTETSDPPKRFSLKKGSRSTSVNKVLKSSILF